MNALTTIEKPKPTVEFRDQWTRQEMEIKTALPAHMPVERFMRVVMTAVNGNPDLLAADRRSLFESAMRAAQDGLLPDGRDGALVIFNTKVNDEWVKKVQWMPMVGGILKKVRNSGELLSIAAYVAYEKDHFEYSLGDEESISHRPCLEEDRGNPRLVYAVAKTKDGGIYREIMTIKDVEKVRNVSRAKNGGPWKDWWDEMAKKTVIRRLAKRLPMSSDLDDLIRRDDDLYDFQGKRADMEGMHQELAAPTVMDRLKMAQKPAEDHEDAREGFSEDFVTRETASLSTAPNSDDAPPPSSSDEAGNSSQAPADQDGDGDSSTSSPSDLSEEAPKTDTSWTEVERQLLIECCDKLIEVATSKDNTPEQRRGILAQTKDVWKAELPAKHHPKLKQFFEYSDDIIKGQKKRDDVVRFFASMLECSVRELGGVDAA